MPRIDLLYGCTGRAPGFPLTPPSPAPPHRLLDSCYLRAVFGPERGSARQNRALPSTVSMSVRTPPTWHPRPPTPAAACTAVRDRTPPGRRSPASACGASHSPARAPPPERSGRGAHCGDEPGSEPAPRLAARDWTNHGLSPRRPDPGHRTDGGRRMPAVPRRRRRLASASHLRELRPDRLLRLVEKTTFRCWTSGSTCGPRDAELWVWGRIQSLPASPTVGKDAFRWTTRTVTPFYAYLMPGFSSARSYSPKIRRAYVRSLRARSNALTGTRTGTPAPSRGAVSPKTPTSLENGARRLGGLEGSNSSPSVIRRARQTSVSTVSAMSQNREL